MGQVVLVARTGYLWEMWKLGELQSRQHFTALNSTSSLCRHLGVNVKVEVLTDSCD